MFCSWILLSSSACSSSSSSDLSAWPTFFEARRHERKLATCWEVIIDENKQGWLTVKGYIFQYFWRHGLPSSGCNTMENISLYCLISLVYFRLFFKLSLIRSSTTRGTVVLFCHGGPCKNYYVWEVITRSIKSRRAICVSDFLIDLQTLEWSDFFPVCSPILNTSVRYCFWFSVGRVLWVTKDFTPSPLTWWTGDEQESKVSLLYQCHLQALISTVAKPCSSFDA